VERGPRALRATFRGVRREWWVKKITGTAARDVVSNRQARHATKAFLKRKLGLTMTDAEDRALPAPALKAV
jgi:hypothetical protein